MSLSSPISTLIKALVLCTVLVPVQGWASSLYSFDTEGSDISVDYVFSGLSTQSLLFRDFEGRFTIDFDDPSKSEVDVTIRAESVRTSVGLFNELLRGTDFFDTANHPDATFKSTSVERIAMDSYQVTGDLMIKGITRSVTLIARQTGQAGTASDPARTLLFELEGQLKRSDFNLGLNAPLTSDEVDLKIQTELVRVTKS